MRHKVNTGVNTGANLETGALNLLVNCVGVKANEQVLIISETPDEKFYCPQMSDILTAHSAELGARPTQLSTQRVIDPIKFQHAISASMTDTDHTIFLHRNADYSRFLPLPGDCSKTLCYVLDAELLASPFAGISFDLMNQLLQRLENELLQAKQWRITCPLGTDISGTFCWPSLMGGVDDDFSLALFPVTTFKPVPCNTANGRVKLSRWLIPCTVAKTPPAVVPFDEPVNVQITDGMISAIDGPVSSANAVMGHYKHLANTLNICPDRVHSWHTGINPHTFYTRPIEENLERWGAISFASPRYLHFHTCGDTAPGEIAWSVFNPSVWIDHKIYWQDGQFVWLKRPDNRSLINQYPGAECLFKASADIGI